MQGNEDGGEASPVPFSLIKVSISKFDVGRDVENVRNGKKDGKADSSGFDQFRFAGVPKLLHVYGLREILFSVFFCCKNFNHQIRGHVIKVFFYCPL